MSDSDVVIIDDTVEEVTVNGNNGGGTDTFSIPAEMYEMYGRDGMNLPGGVTISMPPPDRGGGDSGPTNEEVTDGLTYTAAGFSIAAFLAGATTAGTALGITGVIFGLAAYENNKAGSRRSQPDYRRPAGSTIPVRSLSPPGRTSADRSLEKLLAVERTSAVFSDAMGCSLGAMVVADAKWTQRHALAAAVTYRERGEAFLAAAATLEDLAPQLRSAAAQANKPTRHPADGFPALLADARPVLGLSPDDEAHLTKLIVPSLARGIPSDAQVRSAVQTFRQRGRRLVQPKMKQVRFVFVA